MTSDMCMRMHTLLDNVPQVIDNFSLNVRAPDGHLDVVLYVSFDCESDDELEDVFQAVIDVLCCSLVHDSDMFDHATIQMMYPGAVAEEDMYELGERAHLNYEKKERYIDVRVFKSASVKPIQYTYEVDG